MPLIWVRTTTYSIKKAFENLKLATKEYESKNKNLS